MKVSKKYSLIIYGFQNYALLVRGKSLLAKWLQRKSTCGIRILDCNFEQVKHNINYLRTQNIEVYESRR